MNTGRKVRSRLLLGAMLAAMIVLLFLWVTTISETASLRGVLTDYLLVLGAFAVIVFIVFFMKADLYDDSGKLEKNRILSLITAVLIVVQVMFGFIFYIYKQMNFSFDALDRATSLFFTLQKQSGDNTIGGFGSLEKISGFLSGQVAENEIIESVSIIDDNRVVVVSTDKELTGKVHAGDPLSFYQYPINDGKVIITISVSRKSAVTQGILTKLVTILAASLFLTVELVLFVIKAVNERITPPEIIDGKPPVRALSYVRQIAFLFYFSSRMAASFIPVLAKAFGGNLLGITGNVLAGLPQSAETAMTCISIFLTSLLIERKGWKVSFVMGAALVALGTLASAFAPTIALFMLTRAVVGMGYGFCWMTLRNLALFSRTFREKTEGFSLLNAGLYAGINCGSVLGSILAEQLGYRTVLLVAAVFTALCALVVTRLENRVYTRPQPAVSAPDSSARSGVKGLAHVTAYTVLLIIPSCITISFLGYFLPIYFQSIGYGVSDAGRAQLLYGLMIIYAGPYFARLISQRPDMLRWNVGYVLLFGCGLALFGWFGGFALAMAVVLMIGLADSFGFVVQNNYFLDMKIIRHMGASKSLSLLSFIKKLGEMTGPIVFGIAMGTGGSGGVFTIGILFAASAALYYLIRFRAREA